MGIALKGTVDSIGDLPPSAENGDVYWVTDVEQFAIWIEADGIWQFVDGILVLQVLRVLAASLMPLQLATTMVPCLAWAALQGDH